MIKVSWIKHLEMLIVPQPVKKFSAFFLYPKVHYRVLNNPSLVSIPSQMNPVHALPSFLFSHLILVLSSQPRFGCSKCRLSFMFYHQNSLCISRPSYACHILYPSKSVLCVPHTPPISVRPMHATHPTHLSPSCVCYIAQIVFVFRSHEFESCPR